MIKKIRFFLIVLAVFYSSHLFASSSFAPNTISTLIVHDFGTDIIVVLKNSDTKNLEGCGDNTQITLKRNHPLFKEMYAALLVAFHSQASISGWVHGCAPFNPTVPIISRLDISR